MKIKIHGGTRNDAKPLCNTCQNGWLRRGAAQGQEIMICTRSYENHVQITYPIVECSEYRDSTLPSLSDMTKIAWFVTADKRTGRVGFVTADKADEDMRNAVHDGNPLS